VSETDGGVLALMLTVTGAEVTVMSLLSVARAVMT
jgi:hypothetical protein